MAGEAEERNARIRDTFLGIEDHGLFIAQIGMDYGGSHQGFQRILDYSGDNSLTVIRQILEVIGVDSWEALRGKHCRVRVKDGFIRHIGNILDDKWTIWPEDEAAQEGGGDGG